MGIKKYLPYAAGAAILGGMVLKGGLGGLLGGCGKSKKPGEAGAGGCSGKSCGTCKGSGREKGTEREGQICRTCNGDGVINTGSSVSGSPTQQSIDQLQNMMQLRGLSDLPASELPGGVVKGNEGAVINAAPEIPLDENGKPILGAF